MGGRVRKRGTHPYSFVACKDHERQTFPAKQVSCVVTFLKSMSEMIITDVNPKLHSEYSDSRTESISAAHCVIMINTCCCILMSTAISVQQMVRFVFSNGEGRLCNSVTSHSINIRHGWGKRAVFEYLPLERSHWLTHVFITLITPLQVA